ncbi:MAG: AAA family ATPase [Acidobacteriaceae bacterium]
MKITHITAENFLGIRNVDVKLPCHISIFAGANHSGKSSLQEAVRHALVGESVRVAQKKDYGRLISEGADSGFSEVACHGEKFSIALPSGKGTHSQNEFLPYVLDAQRFAQLDLNERRAFLFVLMGLKAGGQAVKERLQAKGLNMEKVEIVFPLLRSGFDAAEKEAAAKARDAKASWKTVTGGETWGKDKADGWAPEALDVDGEKAQKLYENAKARLGEFDAQIQDISQQIGAAKALEQRIKANLQARSKLEETAGKFARIQDKLNRDEVELKEWQDRVDEAQAHANGKKIGLIHDLAHALVLFIGEGQPLGIDRENYQNALKVIDRYEQEHGPAMFEATNSEKADKLPEYQKALQLLQNAVSNGKRDLEEANRAAEKLKEIDADIEEIPDFAALQVKLDELNDQRRSWRQDEEKYRDAAEAAASREATIQKAAQLHKSVVEWLSIADALSPSGIPGEMLSEALDPINEQLTVSSQASGWRHVVIHPDMRITMDDRDYGVLSESEKWRSDAMIAEAIAHISGIKIMVLDRFDVLDLRGRGQMIVWMHSLAIKGEIDTALIFGTMKALPSGLPGTVEAFWIENGSINQMQHAA